MAIEKLIPLHLFDVFDVIALLEKDDKKYAMNLHESGLYEKFTSLRDGMLIGEIEPSEENKRALTHLTNTAVKAIDLAVFNGNIKPRLNEEIVYGLTKAYEQGVKTVVYSTGTQELSKRVINNFGISDLISAYISNDMLISGTPDNPGKLPIHFQEIKERIRLGKEGGITDFIGDIKLMVDDKLSYAINASLAGLKGYCYNPRIEETKTLTQKMDDKETQITLIQNLDDMYRLEKII